MVGLRIQTKKRGGHTVAPLLFPFPPSHSLREPHKNPLNRSAGTCLYTTYRFAMIERIERIERIYLLNLPNLPNHPQRGLVVYKLDRKRSIEKIGKIFRLNRIRDPLCHLWENTSPCGIISPIIRDEVVWMNRSLLS